MLRYPKLNFAKNGRDIRMDGWYLYNNWQISYTPYHFRYVREIIRNIYLGL